MWKPWIPRLFKFAQLHGSKEARNLLLNPPLSEITKDLSNVTSGKSVLPKIAYPYITEYFRACVTFNFSAALRVSSYQISSKENNIHNFVLPSEKKFFFQYSFVFPIYFYRLVMIWTLSLENRPALSPSLWCLGKKLLLQQKNRLYLKLKTPPIFQHLSLLCTLALA